MALLGNRTTRRSVVSAPKRTVPSAATGTSWSSPPVPIPTDSGREAAVPSVVTSRRESTVRGPSKSRVSVGARSAPSATQVVVGSPSTAAQAPARGSDTAVLLAATRTRSGSPAAAAARRASTAGPGRGVTVTAAA